MIARMGASEISAVLGRRRAVGAALDLVPEAANLASPEAAVPWEPLKGLYAALDGLPGVGVARATKLLHKERPALMPILDEVVVRYLKAVQVPTTT